MEKIVPVKIERNMSVRKLVEQLKCSAFNARNLYNSCEIFREMANDRKCVKFLGLSGAMVPAGMKQIVIDMVKKGMVDVIVSTGANMTHDIIEAIGHSHYMGSDNADDVNLRKKKIDRIYDIYMKDEVYFSLEDFAKRVFSGIKEEIGAKELLKIIGENLEGTNSIARACYEKDVPIFCPGISDSGLGQQVWINEVKMNASRDWSALMGIVMDAEKTGCLLVGGGVPKNHILQALQFSPKTHSYAIQIKVDSPVWGGLSGATLREGISWGKISPDAKVCELYCDATIALPIIMAYANSG